ncbi:DUF4149 domain-containing protein [Polyangium sorediatum]|uniref:DUF4149 domain-containing protein n=1 Tax=Polyangium sorediatum TaxID=889274 RepID=A0ABT6NUY2_9BACT|nr:DUF4149 domain-containing protein [Polyangium sorediatum]MDI1432114.1 DUF4149 domain-containing protein [Polyangium sorediatum]
MNDTFTEADLAPDPQEKRDRLLAVADRVAALVAVLAGGVYIGGMIALGAGAAPIVFSMLPRSIAGDVMGAIFARFDAVALGAALAVLAAEVTRMIAARRRGRTILSRLRRSCTLFMAVCAAYVALSLSPRINDLHRQGVQRDDTPQGQVLEAVHKRAELFGKIGMGMAFGLVVLSVFTIQPRRPEDEEDDEEAAAPLPPGPRDD